MVHTGLRSIVPISINSLDDSNGIAVWLHDDYFAQIRFDLLAGDAQPPAAIGDDIEEASDGLALTVFAARQFGRVAPSLPLPRARAIVGACTCTA